jgi:hypothetical protein
MLSSFPAGVTPSSHACSERASSRTSTHSPAFHSWHHLACSPSLTRSACPRALDRGCPMKSPY